MTNQVTASPPAGFRIDHRERPADRVAIALWRYNREWAITHDGQLPDGVTVAAGPELFDELTAHTVAGIEPRRWTQPGPGTLACLRATVYAGDATVVATARGFRIIHDDDMQPEAIA